MVDAVRRTPRRTRSRPGRPTMSPMKSSLSRGGCRRVDSRNFDANRRVPRRSAMRGTETRSSPLASAARVALRVARAPRCGPRARSGRNRARPGESSRRAALRRGALLADDQHARLERGCAPRRRQRRAGRRRSRPSLGLEDVERGRALAGERLLAGVRSSSWKIRRTSSRNSSASRSAPCLDPSNACPKSSHVDPSQSAIGDQGSATGCELEQRLRNSRSD